MSVVSDTLSHENLNAGENTPDEFNSDLNGKCNLIVNYLPHDVDDNGLRVSECFFFLLLWFEF